MVEPGFESKQWFRICPFIQRITTTQQALPSTTLCVVMSPVSIHEDAASIPDLLHWFRIRELWCRSQTQLGSCVAVAVAGSCSSDLTTSLGIPYAAGVAQNKTNKQKVSFFLKR